MRLFVAIEIPRALHAPLLAIPAQLGATPRTWKLTAAEQLHLTMRFIGPHDDPGALMSAIATSVATIAPFDIRLVGAGTFGTPRRPNVLWAGVHEPPGAPLSALARALDTHLDPLVGPRDHAFRAHVTLGRRRAARAALDLHVDLRAAELAAGLAIGLVPVDEIVLFDSETRPSGAVHREVGRRKLGGKKHADL